MTKSYTSSARGPRALVRETRNLIRAHSHDAPAQVAEVVARLHAMEDLVRTTYGLELRDQAMLDVGAGQRLLELKFFSTHNDVTGIDRDLIVQGLEPAKYVQMLFSNGPTRTAKTIGRKALGVDRRQTRELARLLGVSGFPRLNVQSMDAGAMTFAHDSFDVVYSFAVFQHLEDPAAVLSEMRRVLRPGGVAYLDFILYTSRTGAHDLRLLGGGTADIPLWAHLRPDKSHLVQQTAYLNRLRLPEWRRIFDEHMPGNEVVLMQPEGARLEPEARRLREMGELEDYAVEELITAKVAVLWRKPTLMTSDPAAPEQARAAR